MDSLSNSERELYQDAAKKTAVSRVFERTLLSVTALAGVSLLAYVGYFQFQYQQQARVTTQQRNEQLRSLAQSNEEIKAYIRCSTGMRGTTQENDLLFLDNCVKTNTKQIPPISQ